MVENDVYMEEIFNPNEFTEKELLKLVYRDLHQLQKDFEDYKKNNDQQARYHILDTQLTSVRNELAVQKALREQSEKNTKKYLAIGGFVLLVLELLFKLV